MGAASAHLERVAVWADETLPPLDEAFLVVHNVADLDNVARHLVLEDFDRLLDRHAARKELDEIARFEKNERIPRLARGLD